jgi:uncharacterized protein (DUF924 family)
MVRRAANSNANRRNFIFKKIEKQEKIDEKEKSLQLYSQIPNHILHYKYGQRKRERKKKGGRYLSKTNSLTNYALLSPMHE